MPRTKISPTATATKSKPDSKNKNVGLSDQLSDIAGRLDIVAIAIFGIQEISSGDPAAAPLMTLVQEIGHQVRAIADEMDTH